MKEHVLTAEPTHSAWNRDLAPRLVIEPGDLVQMECLDASGGQVTPASTVDDFLAIDRGRIHALTGPIAIEGAEAGDVLAIHVLEVAHKGWAWTSIISGLGLLEDRFKDPYLFQWDLQAEVTRSLAPAVIPLHPFCGVMGVTPHEAGSFPTRPPGKFGGNMDVRQLHAGAILYLPVMHPRALFSAGDAHAAQGDGEVCINGMECPADVRLRFALHRHAHMSGPLVEIDQKRGAPGGEWIVVESDPDARQAAKNATNRMVDLLMKEWGFSDVHAYLLCSVAMNLRLSQVVNLPMTTVSAAISKSILPARRLFSA